jgi:hypothetical protein
MASARDAFAVVADPETYPRWLVGASAIREVDETWPRPGSRFEHLVGFGRLRIADHTEVLDFEQNALLRLQVRARPLISAIVTFRVMGCDSSCVITLEEEPAVRVVGTLVRPVMDPTIHVRNHRSLRLLEQVIRERSPAPTSM